MAEQEFKFLFKPHLLHLYLNNSEFMQQGGRKKRTAKFLCATNVTGLLLLWGGGGVLPQILDRGVPRRFVNPNPI